MRAYSKIVRLVLAAAMVVVSGNVFAADKNITTDIVIVGGGSTGLAAAVTAAEGGASVVVLEKNPYLGGSSSFAEGLFGVETEQTRKHSYGLSKDEAFKHIMEFGHYKVNAPLLRQFINATADNIAWLEERGISFEVIQISPAEPLAWHIIQPKDHYRLGGVLVTTLQKRAGDKGVTFMLRTPAKKLIYSGNRVTGVEAVDASGNKVIVKAKVVIIGTGGFGNSKEKIKEWTKFDPEAHRPILPLNKTGDGIQMAKDVGAFTEGENLMLFPGTEGKGIRPLGSIWTMTWNPAAVWVNGHGERFADESVAFSFAQAGNAISRQAGHYAWSIFDDDTVDHVMTKGIDYAVGVIVPVTTKLETLREEINGAVAVNSESFKAADSIEELAGKIGVPVKNLEKSFADYNKYASNGYDKQFLKDHRYMKPLNKGRIYAVKVMPYHFVSIGGMRVNNQMAVLDKNDNPIKGLYGGGCDIGGLYSDTYTLWASGHAYAWAVYSGRMAAQSALADIK